MLRRFMTFAAVGALTLTGLTGLSAPAGAADPIGKQLASMTLEQKVGQMFVTYVYGGDANTVSAADATANRNAFGADADTGAKAVAKYHLGGVIYFTWSNNLANP